MTRPSLTVRVERFPVRGTFTISRGSTTEAVVVVAEIAHGGHVGRGECVPYGRYGETVDRVAATIKGLAREIARGLDRPALQARLPAGGARNALDCALFDLEAKTAGRPAWALAGLAPPAPILTAYTLSLGTPAAMAEAARLARRPLLKLKLGGAGDAERLAAVREAAPEARLIVDANEAWSPAELPRLMAVCAEVGVELIEQPLPAADDGALAAVPHLVPVCADESVHDRATLAALKGRYDAVNIKLDKTGGLTEALALAAAARAQGFSVMVGCMLATSLAMAPALLVAQYADFVDLDGPLLLARDREPGLTYDGSTVMPAPAGLWG